MYFDIQRRVASGSVDLIIIGNSMLWLTVLNFRPLGHQKHSPFHVEVSLSLNLLQYNSSIVAKQKW